MTASPPVVSLLVFEAAGCLMAVPASEISQLDSRAMAAQSIDLDRYFAHSEADGPWLRWVRESREASLRVRRVIDVIQVPIARLAPMPEALRGGTEARAFVAAGVRGDDVFLLLDPGRLTG